MYNVAYFNPQDKMVLYRDSDPTSLVTYRLDTKEEGRYSEYYVNSPHWNGESPFIPVNIQVSSLEELDKHPLILDIYMVEECKIFLDMLRISRDETFTPDLRQRCREAALEILRNMEKCI